jgi:plastocyanin
MATSDFDARSWSNPAMHTGHRRLLRAAVLAGLATLVTATVALGHENEEVIISDTLQPARLEVSSGTLVTWRNEDDERHRVRSRQGPVEFDSGNLEPGERFTVTFVVAGEYPYLDERDDDAAYSGTIIVTGAPATGGPPPTAGTVRLINESFQPPALEVAVGATVTWENIDGDDDHTVTSTEGAFDSGVLSAGSAFEHTFDAPGTYPYFCAIHPEMEGTITVIGGATGPTDSAVVGSPGASESPVTDGEPTLDDTVTGGPAAVSIVDLTFEPPVIEVESGSSVTWTNDDSVPHTATANDGAFDSGVLMTGDAFSQTFDTPGSYDYSCAIHPSMTGTVVVVEPAAAGADTEAVAADAAVAAEVAAVDLAFEPADIEVAVGTTVDWTNDDPFDHTITARDGAFDSGVMAAGDTFSQTFDSPGTYEYFCAIHPSMTGTVTVTPAEGG